jgi:hypothetical protein
VPRVIKHQKFTHALFSTKCYSNWQDIASGNQIKAVGKQNPKKEEASGGKQRNERKRLKMIPSGNPQADIQNRVSLYGVP